MGATLPSRGGRSRRAPMAEINVTPLVDVMLVLLIIFMVTAPLLVAGVPVDLPESRAGALDQQAKPVQIALDKDGGLYIDDQPVSDDVSGGPAADSQHGRRFGSVLRHDAIVEAPPRTVAGVLRDSVAAAEALYGAGHRLTSAARLLADGDEVRVAVRLLPGVRVPLRTRITHVGADGMTSVLARGPLRALEHVTTLTAGPTGTWVRDELRWTAPETTSGK